MVNLIKFVAILFFVLPALIYASSSASSSTSLQGCQISVSSRLQDAQEHYNVYTATIANIGSDSASNVVLTPSADVRKVSGLQEKDGKYELSNKIAAGDSVTFKYKSKKATTVVWTATCDGTVPPTAAATAKATTSPKSSHTTAPTTTTTTKAPTKAPTTTKKGSSKTTTQAPAKSTTAAPTSAPVTSSNTAAPTTAPSSGSTGKVCPGTSRWQPTPYTTWQWQLTGKIDMSFDVQMYDIDLFDNTADTIAQLHAQGRVVICYFSTQYENWRPDSSMFTPAVIGNPLDGWPGENYVDIRSPVVRNIMVERLQLALSKGCDGVEPDNVDGYQNDSGFPVTAADQINFNEFIAAQGQAIGLSVGLKNDPDQAKTLQPFFDWTLNEQCHQYDECDTLSSFITANKAVFNCEYKGTSSSVCPDQVALHFSTLIKPLSLTATVVADCCTLQPGGCSAKAAYSCVTASA